MIIGLSVKKLFPLKHSEHSSPQFHSSLWPPTIKKKIRPAEVGYESEAISYSELISTAVANNNSKLFIDYP